MRLGINQIRLLVMTASPTSILLNPDKVSASLVRLGLMREREPGKSCCITALGLRALADAMEAGRVDDALEAIRKDVAAREAKRRSA